MSATPHDRAVEIERLRDDRDQLLVDTVTGLVHQVAQLHRENAELRDAVLALSNRIEAVTRAQAGSGLHSVKS